MIIAGVADRRFGHFRFRGIGAAIGGKAMTAIGLALATALSALILWAALQELLRLFLKHRKWIPTHAKISISDGVQNVARSGVVVPVIYGEVVTGSITISAGLNTEV